MYPWCSIHSSWGSNDLPVVCSKPGWRLIAEYAVSEAHGVVVDLPRLNELLSIVQIEEPVLVQALVPKFAVEPFDMPPAKIWGLPPGNYGSTNRSQGEDSGSAPDSLIGP